MGLFKKKNNHPSGLLIAYGTKTGNAKLVARQTQKYYAKYGLKAVCKNMAKLKPEALQRYPTVLLVVSTQGEGEPPASALRFFRALHAPSMPHLRNIRYAVCALGDSGYEKFCETGKQLDRRLAELGAVPLCKRVDCDVEFSETAIQWIKTTAALLCHTSGGELPNDAMVASEKKYCASIKQRLKLTSSHEVAPVCHLVLDLNDTDLSYQPGDSLKFIPQNPSGLVDALCNYLHLGSNDVAVRQQLLRAYEITSVSKKTLQALAGCTQSQRLHDTLQTPVCKELLARANVYDILTDFKLNVDAETLLGLLPPIKAREYSVASSPAMFPNEIHLTIKTIRFNYKQRRHEGAGSVYANESLQPGTRLEFSMASNPAFCLPASAHAPLILIGVSTGIAPFRAMLQHKESGALSGEMWLIYGNKFRSKDFLYENELKGFVDRGVLNRIDTAFSRDNDSMKYVQDIILDQKEAMLDWLGRGAHVYLCGSIKMGQSVRQAVHRITADTAYSPENLMETQRWFEDVY